MARDKRDDDAPSNSTYEGGGINAGVAVVGFILCFLAGGLLMWGYDAKKMKAGGGDITADSTEVGGAWSDEDAAIPISSKDPMWGKRDAPVTIVQFSDFQCPFCSRVEPTIDQVKQTYGPDKVRIVWKNAPLPFHPNAKPAAEAAVGVFTLAGNDAFWKFHDTAFKNQSALSPASYEQWAQAAGVKDMAAFKAGIDSHKWADKVDKDNAVGKQAGVNGTPAAFVNGVLLSGAQPFDKFKAVIDQELSKAQAKIASGTPKNKVYVAMSQDNKKNAPAAAAAPDKGEEKKEDTTTGVKVPAGNSPVLGNPNALVTIIEFSDFQCPYCKRVEPTLKTLRDKYGDKIRLIWKNEPLPFHPRAEPAAEVAMEGLAEKGNKGFWDLHDRLFDSQPKIDDPDLDKVATDAGLSLDKVHDAMKNHKWKSLIDADNDLADDMQASGTPHFFVNGRRLVGAQPADKFKAIIDEELKKAQAMVSKGIAAKDVYAEIIKDGKEPPPPERKTVDAPVPDSPSKGLEKSKVVMEIFSDFQCPFCKKVEDTVKQVEKAYGDKIRIVWRHNPLGMHADAPLASQAAQEVFKEKGKEAFWKFHDVLFDKQGSSPDALKRPALETYAEGLGIDMPRFRKALDSNANKPFVDADMAAATKGGISGAPAFVVGSIDKGQINGYFINGAVPFGKFKKAIDRALKEADAKK